MRVAQPLLVALIAVAPVACSGDDAPPPIEQRFLTAEDAPGTERDPVEGRHTTTSDAIDGFFTVYGDGLVDPDREEVTTLLEEAGYVGAGKDSRFLGETHSPDVPHLISSYIELDSEDGAKGVLDWLEADAQKPCPESCAVRFNTFDVQDIEDARGVHRVATAEDIEAAGFEGQQPFDSYWVAFIVGPVVYAVDLRQNSTGSLSEEQALEIAGAYHDRLTGS